MTIKMIKPMRKFILPFVVLLALGACSAPPALPTPTGAPAAPPTELPTPTPLPPTLEPTATPLPTDTPQPTATAAPLVFGPGNYPATINPLTGLAVSDPALLERRPLSVKIQIFPRGQRPPWGVSLADIVYDYYQNNGMTRFHAIFYGQNAEQAGPIRSGRLFDGSIVNMYNSIFAFGGADRRIYSQFLSSSFANRLIVEGSGNCPPMCRIDPNGFNYLIADTAALSAYAIEKGISNERPNLEGMSFDSRPPAGGQPGTQIDVRHSISAYARWNYDPASNKYLRSQDTQEDMGQGEAYEAMIDRLTNQQISAANVVVLFMPHMYVYRSNSGSSEIVDADANGSGTAYAYRDGQVYQVKWVRPGKNSVLVLTFTDGTPYPFHPGNTWFEVIGSTSKIQADGATIRFQFAIP